MATTTTGWNRISTVTARVTGGVEQQVVPNAIIAVTSTLTGGEATIYSDAGLSIAIPNGIVTADLNGNYSYYLQLNYCVTENISSPNRNLLTLQNIVMNGPLVGSLTTTAATSDTVNITGILSTSRVSLQPTNAAAATMFTSTYVSAKSTGSITITHPATANATFDLIITPY